MGQTGHSSELVTSVARFCALHLFVHPPLDVGYFNPDQARWGSVHQLPAVPPPRCRRIALWLSLQASVLWAHTRTHPTALHEVSIPLTKLLPSALPALPLCSPLTTLQGGGQELLPRPESSLGFLQPTLPLTFLTPLNYCSCCGVLSPAISSVLIVSSLSWLTQCWAGDRW